MPRFLALMGLGLLLVALVVWNLREIGRASCRERV